MAVLGSVQAAALTEGEAAAPVTLVEYGDFECPYSREAVKTIQALQREFSHDLRFVFRHFPLAAKHPHAVQAAEAAEAAAAQGKFWAMYATLFAHQWELEYGDLMDYAGQLGLDKARFGGRGHRASARSTRYADFLCQWPSAGWG